MKRGTPNLPPPPQKIKPTANASPPRSIGFSSVPARKGAAMLDFNDAERQAPDRTEPVKITWDDLRKIEMAVMPLMILAGGDEEERDPEPPQSLVRLHLRVVWKELAALARRVGGANG
jgi:hypothetical protein